MGSPSFFQLKYTGISPDETEHVTCARPPSCKFFGKLKGSMTGGAAKKKKNKLNGKYLVLF